MTSTHAPLRVHAIYAVLDELPLFRASLASIYDQVDRITVITTHDRDWRGLPRDPSATTAAILSRDLDPDRKIDLIVSSETNEGRARNRAMDYAAASVASRAVRKQHRGDEPLVPPDYFLIIDADEIYEANDFRRIVAYIARDRRQVYRVPCIRYFKRWNYRVDGYEWAFAFVRADWRIENIRGRRASLPRRALARVPSVPGRVRDALRGFVDIPADIGVFHHGSYVGPRARMEAKLAGWGHADDVAPNWLEDVWDQWSVESKDFNPAFPDLFPGAAEIDPAQLPDEISIHEWPSEYLDLRS